MRKKVMLQKELYKGKYLRGSPGMMTVAAEILMDILKRTIQGPWQMLYWDHLK